MNRATAVTNGVEDAENRLKVITKRQWLQLKQKFKEERKERKERVKQMKQITQFGYSVGVLVRVHGLNGVFLISSILPFLGVQIDSSVAPWVFVTESDVSVSPPPSSSFQAT